MFVCLCMAVTDREVDDAIRRGADTIEAVGQMTGAGTDCGGCHCEIEKRIACQARKAAAHAQTARALPVLDGASVPA